MKQKDIYEDHTLNKSQRERIRRAIEYAERGYPVLFTQGKQPVYGTHGVKDATTDTETLIADFKQNPKRNIAAATGHKFWVADLDISEDKGVDGFDSLYNHFGDDLVIDTKKHMIQKTPSGGVHLFIELPDDGLPVPSPVGVLPGLDIRGLGTYVVMAPSVIRLNGKWEPYRLKNDETDCFIPMCKWTTELLRMARERGSIDKPNTVKKAFTDGLDEGERDTNLFKIACWLRDIGIDPDTNHAVMKYAAEKCNPPFDFNKLQEKITYAYSYSRLNTVSDDELLTKIQEMI